MDLIDTLLRYLQNVFAFHAESPLLFTQFQFWAFFALVFAGFSLVRKVFDVEHADLGRHVDALGMPLGEALLTPTRIYVKPVLRLLESVAVKGIAHITGGGFYENLPRSLPDGIGASIEKRAVPVLPIFDMIRRAGHVDERDMFNTFNMGVGMTLIVAAADLDAAMAVLEQAGERPVLLGHTVSGEGVTLC